MSISHEFLILIIHDELWNCKFLTFDIIVNPKSVSRFRDCVPCCYNKLICWVYLKSLSSLHLWSPEVLAKFYLRYHSKELPTGEASREEINNSTAHIILFIVVMLMYGCLIILMSVLLDYFDVCFAPLNYQLLKT